MSYPMRRAALALVGALAGCGAGRDEPPGVVDAPGQDAQPGCHVSISFEPSPVIAGPDTVVRATAEVDSGFGVQTFAWLVARAGVQVPTELAQADGSAIAFPAPLPGVYDVRVDVSGPSGCPAALTALTVLAEGANASQLRLHVTPPASAAAPPLDKRIVVLGGGDVALNTVSLDRGVVATGAVVAGATPVPAYLRFMPAAAKDAAVDAFSDLAGAFSVRVVDQPHDVLIVPAIPGYAPALVEDWLPFEQNLAITAGTPVHGVVRDPAGAPLANAKVQLAIDGLPSTLATTAANGAFTVHARPVAGATITVDVAPPEGRGLPRLVASSTELALAQSLDIAYAPLAIRDLAGAIVRRQGSPLAGTQVTVVGSLPAAGTVTTGASSASATGTLRV
ncbi:MAG: carboxypeptidase-like regulatory domain-containing protein, partial [Kofleriaceae bacterium]